MRMNTLKSYEKAVQQYFFQGTLDSLPNFVQRYLMAIPPCDDSEWMAWEKTEKTKSSKEDLSVTEKTKSSSCESCEDKNTKTKPAI